MIAKRPAYICVAIIIASQSLDASAVAAPVLAFDESTGGAGMPSDSTVGYYGPSFSVQEIPEPSALTLAIFSMFCWTLRRHPWNWRTGRRCHGGQRRAFVGGVHLPTAFLTRSGQMSGNRLLAMVVMQLLVTHAGCADRSREIGTTWQDKVGWEAEDFFDDPQVIALCDALEESDIATIERLVESGANVNARGRDNMTPLLWAFPDNKLDRFVRLLELGADPNVIIDSDLGTRGYIPPGSSVTHLVCRTPLDGYFKAVFAHGGDPNLVMKNKVFRHTPLVALLSSRAPDKKGKIQTLIEKGANLNYGKDQGWTPALLAVPRFDLCLMLLEAGVDHRVYQENSNSKLIHVVIKHERISETWSPQQWADYEKLVQWLVDHGESIEEAKWDLARWASWNHASGEYRRKMDAEIAERKAREAREAEATDHSLEAGR